jgi:hypothetical protein
MANCYLIFNIFKNTLNYIYQIMYNIKININLYTFKFMKYNNYQYYQ